MKTYKRIAKLNEAVKFLSGLINKPLRVADIATDHGYLAECLSKEEFVFEVLATDISKNSLSKLEKLIKLKKLQKIKTAVGDGLEPIDSADISVIAGIGGHEIIKIIKNQNENHNGDMKCRYFVLQPAQNVLELREWLFNNKIMVLKDYIIEDAERFYPIIIIDLCKKQKNKKNIYNLWLGRDNKDDEDFILFIKELYVSLGFVKNIKKTRIRKDKVLYQKYKLYRIIEKLLKV